MSPSMQRRRSPETTRDVRHKIRDSFHRHITRPRRKEYANYIGFEHIKSAWADLETIEQALPSIDKEQAILIQQNLPRFLSILIYLNAADCLDNFHDRFFDQGGRPLYSDAALPLPDESIPNIGDNVLKERFFEDQHIFTPVIIDTTEDVMQIEFRRRLPFESESDHPTKGAYGEVSRVTISASCFKNREGDIVAASKIVACKRFPIADDAEKEAKTLSILKNSTMKHDHIRYHYAVLLHRDEHIILFPWADKYDLDFFLLEGNDAYVFDKVFPDLSRGYALSAMCTQMAEIASALDWLHKSIKVEQKHVPLAHLDLKPDNILIETDTNSIVGRWVLTDFGISITQEKEGNGQSDLFSLGDFVNERLTRRTTSSKSPTTSHYVPEKWTMRVAPPRKFGTYQPPEVSHLISRSAGTSGRTMSRYVGRSGDIWSFGCILAEVFAFSMGRRAAVESFGNARVENGNDDFWSLIGERPEPRRKVRDWLLESPKMFPNSDVTPDTAAKSIEAIDFILKVDSKDRPSASAVNDKISRLAAFVKKETQAAMSRSIEPEGTGQMREPYMQPTRVSPTVPLLVNQENVVRPLHPPFDFESEEFYAVFDSNLKTPGSTGRPVDRPARAPHNKMPETITTRDPDVNPPFSDRPEPTQKPPSPKEIATPQSILDFNGKLRSVATTKLDAKASGETVVSAVALCPSGRRLAVITNGQGDYTLKNYEISLESRKIGHEVNSTALQRKVEWKNVSICNNTLVAWGHSPQGYKQIFLADTQTILSSKDYPCLGELRKVLISTDGCIIIVCENWSIWYLHHTRNHAVPQPLDTSDNERAGFYVNAAMDNSLNLLYIWSSGGGYHYLHWWRIETVDQKVRLVQHHEKQFPARRGVDPKAELYPFQGREGCLIHLGAGRYFSSLKAPSLDFAQVGDATTKVCVFRDHSMLFTKSGTWNRKRISIMERRINQTSHEIETELNDEQRRLKVNLKIAAKSVAEMKTVSPAGSEEDIILVLHTDGTLFFVPIVQSHVSANTT